jgi:hypothetical protein
VTCKTAGIELIAGKILHTYLLHLADLRSAEMTHYIFLGAKPDASLLDIGN